MAPTRFRVTPTSTHRHVGAVVRLRLEEPTKLRIVVDRRLRGLMSSSRCVRPRPSLFRGNRCVRYQHLGGMKLRHGGGRVRIRLSGRIHGRALSTGVYVLRVYGVDAAGNHSPAQTIDFAVIG